MHEHAVGVPQDNTEAAQWYRLAADQDHARGQLNLGSMYYDGIGVPRDHAEAARLIKLTCDQGYQPARDFVGKLTTLCPAGTRVVIIGLTTSTHLNGRLGTTIKPSKLLAAGQIAVRIDGQTNNMPLSWENTTPLWPATAPGPPAPPPSPAAPTPGLEVPRTRQPRQSTAASIVHGSLDNPRRAA